MITNQGQAGQAASGTEAISGLDTPAYVDEQAGFDWSKFEVPGAKAAPAASGEADAKKGGAASDAGGNAGGQGNAPNTPAAAPVLDLRGVIKEKFGPSADLGDDLSNDNLVDRLSKVFRPQAEEHPEVIALRDSLSKGLTVAQHMEQRTYIDRLIGMNDKELMTTAYRAKYGRTKDNPEGMSEEQIKALVEQQESNGNLLLNAAEQRATLRSEKIRRDEELNKAAKQHNTNWADPAIKQEFAASAAKAAESIAKTSNGRILGLEVAEAADQQALVAVAEKWLIPDPQTNLTRFQRTMQDNNRSVELALVLELMERGHFNKLVLLAKDQAKLSMLDKLELQPARTGGATAFGGGNRTPDLDALSSPARTND